MHRLLLAVVARCWWGRGVDLSSRTAPAIETDGAGGRSNPLRGHLDLKC